MNKSELIAAVASRANITQRLANELLTATVDTIIDQLQQGNMVALPKLGKLVPVTKLPRQGKSPRDGSPIEIAGFTTARLKAGKELKDLLS